MKTTFDSKLSKNVNRTYHAKKCVERRFDSELTEGLWQATESGAAGGKFCKIFGVICRANVMDREFNRLQKKPGSPIPCCQTSVFHDL